LYPCVNHIYINAASLLRICDRKMIRTCQLIDKLMTAD
jgi:hypothetical protein